MEHYCEKKVCCQFPELSTSVNMKFEVSDARNPLASVARITEHGNIVQFGPKEEDNYKEEGSEVRVGRESYQEGPIFRGQA